MSRLLSMEEIARIRSIRDKVDGLKKEIKTFTEEWKELQDTCSHPNLPKRSFGEEYMDTCPDCGYMTYCYMM